MYSKVNRKESPLIDQRFEQAFDWIAKEKESSYSLYTAKEVARCLNVTPQAVYNWKKRWLLGSIQMRHRVYFTDRAVTRFLTKYTIKRRNTLMQSNTIN